MSDPFQRFGFAHLAVLLAVPLLGGALAAVQRRLPRGTRWLRVGVACALLLDTVFWYADLGVHGQLTFPEKAPLELCDATLFLTIVTLFDHRKAIFDIAYYTALAGASMALLTPNVAESFASFSTMQFFIAHGLTIASILYLVWSRQARPRPWSALKALAAVNAYAAMVGAFDAIFRTNFMYLRHKPEAGSLLDLLGPWPWYLVAAEGVAAALFALLYLPFRRPAAVSDAARDREVELEME